MDLLLLPEPDEATLRAVAVALARFPAVTGPLHEAYASPWRVAALAEAVGSGTAEEESAAGVTAARRGAFVA